MVFDSAGFDLSTTKEYLAESTADDASALPVASVIKVIQLLATASDASAVEVTLASCCPLGILLQ